MDPFFYMLIGLAIGFEIGRQAAGGTFDRKRALTTALIALLVAVVIVVLINQLPVS